MSFFQNHSDLIFLSFRRKPESSEFKVLWTPVFTGVTVMGPPERVSRVSTLMKRYTRFLLEFTPYLIQGWNYDFGINVKRRWTHYTRIGHVGKQPSGFLRCLRKK